MRISRKRIIFLVACAWCVIGSGAWTAFAAQTKAAASKGKAASEQRPGATVNLNTASEKDLDNLPGVGPATAKKIIAGRPYSSVGELAKAGVSAATIKKITPLVTASGGTAAAVTSESSKKSSTKTNAKEVAPASQPVTSSATASPPAPASPKTAPSTAPQGAAGQGNVWVNLDSGVYHYSGTRYYGKTKSGKYMSEADAVKAGYHAAENEKKRP